MTLHDIKSNLEDFELFQCGMYHEKVRLDPKTKLPLKTNIIGENQFLRIDLCNSKLRKKRLGCAHSSANLNFNELINKIEIDSIHIKEIQIKINETILNIYELDHKKGNLEKEFAEVLLNTIPNLETRNNIQNKIGICISLHRDYIATLKVLKDELINIIDQTIKNETKFKVN
ncbi:hypothetical protein [Polaribacter sp. SA4-12]|uniref:hypothetical protein n=1 Tax=Polaribacter sp. SA4-12 TaxID=1312072 RepID=UPI000B3D4AC2|nr:hypothetical protein [Polaribacter sp. SA4-12]ARV14485.1 hypothetical protein BTO07_04680 [Polaribacter sp. SA4-12]